MVLTSLAPSALESLPLDIFGGICAQISAAQDPASKRSFIALASTSKRLLGATSPFLLHTIVIRFTDTSANTIAHDVERWTRILNTRGCAQYVRRLSIVEEETVDEWDEDCREPWPPDRGEDDFFERVGDDIWPLDEDDEFWTRPEPISFELGSDVSSAAEKAGEQIVWQPLVDLIASLRGLRDVRYQCLRQIPGSLLAALNEGNGGLVRLHMYGFSLRSQYQHDSAPQDVDEDEYLLATSPCLSSIRLKIPIRFDRPRGCVPDGRICFNTDAVGRMMEGLAPNLRSVSVSATAPRRAPPEDTPWPGFFPSRPGDNTPVRGKGALETLALEEGVPSDPESIRAWAGRTDFAALRSLHLRTQSIQVAELKVLLDIAEAEDLRSLCSLSLWTWGDWGDQAEYEFCDTGEAELSRLLKVLRPLLSLEIKGPFSDELFGAILSCHGPSLRRLRLIPLRSRDIQPEPFVFSRERVKALVRDCPNIEDLELVIPRSRGNEEEARIYRTLAELPVLDRLSLLLDYSDVGGASHRGLEGNQDDGGPSEESSEIAHKPIHNSIINLNTSSLSLAEDIFNALCLYRFPRLIRLYPYEAENMDNEVHREWSILSIRNLLCRAWIQRRDDRAGHEGECTITEVVPRDMESSRMQPIRRDVRAALKEVWPGARQWPRDMDKRESFPLWQPS